MLKAELGAGHQRPHQLVERRRQSIFALGQIRNTLRQLLIVRKSGKGSSKQVGDSCFVVGQGSKHGSEVFAIATLRKVFVKPPMV